jgi:Gas vesicle protein K.
VKSRAAELGAREVEALRQELEQRVADIAPARWNANPEDVQRSVAKLVLTLMEFLRKLFEKQTLRRMEEDSLTPEETEAIGLALMRLEETITDLAGRFGLSVDELNLDLGPLGRLR